MKSRFYLWSLVLVCSLVVTGLSMRYLALENIPYYHSLSSRGLVCLILTIVFAKMNAYPLFPKKPRVQLTRALIAGLALTFLTLSYSWLSASTVSVLSNIDVPLLMVLGPFIGQNSSRRARLLSLVSIVLLIIYVSGLEKRPQLILGLMTLGLGTLLLCFGYLFIKKSMTEENEAVTIAVPSLAIIFYGVIQSDFSFTEVSNWSWIIICISILAGVGMFYAYYSTMRLYREADLARAEFPGVFSSLIIRPIEFLLFDTSIEMTYFLSSALFVMVIYMIILKENSGEECRA